jgi:hypothetical protein
MKYRITHPDPYNWCIEEWQEGGAKIEKGRFQGEVTKAKWKAANEFYPTLREAAKALLNKAAGDAILNNETKDILEAIKIAEERVINSLPQN